MSSMTPPADSARGYQRQAYIVQGDLLDLGLPLLHWQLMDYDFGAYLNGSIISTASTDEEKLEIFARWANALGGRTRSDEVGTDRMAWTLDVERQGVKIRINTSVSKEYGLAHPELPTVAAPLPPRADTYVRRTRGELTEAVAL